MPFRNFLFWVHLVVGVAAGLVILVLCVTGVVLALERPVLRVVEQGGLRMSSEDIGVALAAEALLRRVGTALPDERPVGVTLRADPAEAATVSLASNRTLFVDPRTGAVVGETSPRWRGFFQGVTRWHRWLAGEGSARALGRSVTGAATLALLFLVVSGLCLWWPRLRHRGDFRARWMINGKLSGRARDWNRHNVVGFWSAPPLLVIVLTAVVLSYPWADRWLRRAVGSPPAESRTVPSRPLAPRALVSPPTAEARMEGLDAAWAVAVAKVPGWNYVSFRFPTEPDGPWMFLIDRGDGTRPDLRDLLTLEAGTGRELAWQPYATMDAGQKARGWVRWLHTGEAGGWIGRTIAALASLGGAVLVWTGLALTWRRFAAHRRSGAGETTK